MHWKLAFFLPGKLFKFRWNSTKHTLGIEFRANISNSFGMNKRFLRKNNALQYAVEPFCMDLLKFINMPESKVVSSFLYFCMEITKF